MSLLNRIVTDMSAQKSWTCTEILKLVDDGLISEDDKFELVEGEIIFMAAAKYNPHEAMKNALAEELTFLCNRRFNIGIESSLYLAENTMLEPDIAVWPRGVSTQEINGVEVLLVIEVASSSFAYDTSLKAKTYAKLGIRDYWVVDVNRRQILIHRDPSDTGYQTRSVAEAHDDVTPLLLEVKICLDRLV
jgi:Uma2 family endonuclease